MQPDAETVRQVVLHPTQRIVSSSTTCIDSPYGDGAHPGCHAGCHACWRAFTGSRPKGRSECAGRLVSRETDEWLYVFKPRIAGIVLYVKVVLRADCVVISFHEERGNDDQDQGEGQEA